jgi:hypothetical protein
VSAVPRRVDARDVLDADATTARAFRGRVVGSFRRTGPNEWDDYELVPGDGGAVDVLAGLPIQLEPDGARLRMRRRGEVVVVEWTPDDARTDETAGDVRSRFLESCVRREDPTPDGNLAAWLHRELDEKPKAND